MKHKFTVVLFLFVQSAQSAPLDTLVSARHSTEPWHGELEIGLDVVNDTVDVFDIRGEHQDFSGTNVGDYSGGHLLGGISLTDKLWVEGSLWDRELDYRTDSFSIQSWNLSAQYQISRMLGVLVPDLTMRATVWGNYADKLIRNSSTTIFGRTVDKIEVAKPKDTQWQIDLIGSWDVGSSMELTLFSGMGKGSSDFDSLLVSGQASEVFDFGPGVVIDRLQGSDGTVLVENGEFNDLELSVNNAEDAIQVAGFSVADNVYGIDSGLGISHETSYVQWGGGLLWYNRSWRVRAGYKFMYVDRGIYDDLVVKINPLSNVEKGNHFFVGDISYRIGNQTAVFLRGQVMSNQFLGEIPFSYTPFTSHRFDEKYGYLTAGINYYF